MLRFNSRAFRDHLKEAFEAADNGVVVEITRYAFTKGQKKTIKTYRLVRYEARNSGSSTAKKEL